MRTRTHTNDAASGGQRDIQWLGVQAQCAGNGRNGAASRARGDQMPHLQIARRRDRDGTVIGFKTFKRRTLCTGAAQRQIACIGDFCRHRAHVQTAQDKALARRQIEPFTRQGRGR